MMQGEFMKKMIMCVLMLWALAASAAPQKSCIQEQTTVYLDSLQVGTCLVQSEGASKAKEGEQLPVSHIRQTLKNVGNQPIELQLNLDLIFRMAMTVFLNGKDVTKIGKVGAVDSGQPLLPPNEFHLLKPGQEKVFAYLIADFMTEPPQDGVVYEIIVGGKHGYRYLNEARGYGAILRLEEARAKKQYVKNPSFEGVRLK